MPCEMVWNEYQLLFMTYEGFNAQSLTLKGWSATVGLAALLAVYSEKLGKLGRRSVIVSSLSVVPFWITDAFWKAYQNAYTERLSFLEGISNCADVPDYTFGMFESWDSTHNWYDWAVWLPMPSVFLPHALIVALGLILAWKFPPQVN